MSKHRHKIDLEKEKELLKDILKDICKILYMFCKGITRIHKFNNYQSLLSTIGISCVLYLFSIYYASCFTKTNYTIENQLIYCFTHYFFLVIPIQIIMFSRQKTEDKHRKDYSHIFKRIGMIEEKRTIKDKHGNIHTIDILPTLLNEEVNDDIVKYTFKSTLELEVWEKNRSKLQTILNKRIIKICNSENDFQKIVVIASNPGVDKIPKCVDWDNKYFQEGLVSVAIDGKNNIIQYDMTKENHFLIGGQTDSGKGNFLALMLYNFLKNGYFVNIIDRKGLLDYQDFQELSKNQRHICCGCEVEDIYTITENAINELKLRQSEIKKLKVKNVNSYNKKVSEDKKLGMYLLVIDEASQVFCNGDSDEEKELLKKIKKNILELVRTSRALNIKVIICTQKPSGVAIGTETRSQLGTRACGRMNTSEDSKMVLENSAAAYLKKINGRFIFLRDGELIEAQTFYFKDEDFDLTEWNIKGRILINEIEADKEEKIICLKDNKKGGKKKKVMNVEEENENEDEEMLQELLRRS